MSQTIIWVPTLVPFGSSYGTRPWDYGVKSYARRTVPPEDLPIDQTMLTEQGIRVMNDGAEDDYIRMALVAAVNAAEEATQRALMPQTWTITLDRFPSSGLIRLPRPPFIEVTSVSYYDSDNAAASLAGSPADYEIVSSGQYQHAYIRPLEGETFPSTAARPDAVTVTYRAGFTDTDDPLLQQINMGIVLMVGELYKQRSLSVHAVHNTPALLPLGAFWQCVDPVLA